MTGDNQPNILSSHLGPIFEQVGLHEGGHMAVPERGNDDNGVVVGRIAVNGLDSGIAGCFAGLCNDGIDKIRAQLVVVCRVILTIDGWLNLYNVGFEESCYGRNDVLAITSIAVIYDKRLTGGILVIRRFVSVTLIVAEPSISIILLFS